MQGSKGAVDEAPEASVEISLVNELREIVGVAARIDRFCEARSLDPQLAYAVNLSVDEILTNTITHGYDDEESHRIEVIVRVEGQTLVVVIVDDSEAFDPSRAPQPDVEASLESGDLEGLGLFLVHQMMDRVEYRRVDGCNVVTLTRSTADKD